MLEGHHYQNAYVTRDIEKWVRTFEQRAKIDRLLRYEGTMPVTTPNGPATQTNKLAFIASKARPTGRGPKSLSSY